MPFRVEPVEGPPSSHSADGAPASDRQACLTAPNRGPAYSIMSRLLTILYVIVCFEMGVFLFVLPWLSIWTRNYFVGHYSLVSAIALNYFFRGAISGIGLADIWLAVYELWRLRKNLGLVVSRRAG